MKSVSVADLRNNFRRIASWIKGGETVQILKRGRAFAQLTTVKAERQSRSHVKVDFMAQLKEIWGDRVFTMKEVQAMRDASDLD